MHWITSRRYLYAEFIGLTMLAPILILAMHWQRYMLLILWVVMLYCIVVGRALNMEPIRINWRRAAISGANMRPILLRFAACAVILALGTAFFKPENLFGFVRNYPAFWALVMVLYPLLSAIPQEIIYRWFFFRRYAPIFSNTKTMIFASAITFAIAHIIFNNWVSPLLCIVGGAIFAATYAHRKSLALVSLEHALYGDFVFTIGLGWYFYHGAH